MLSVDPTDPRTGRSIAIAVLEEVGVLRGENGSFDSDTTTRRA